MRPVAERRALLEDRHAPWVPHTLDQALDAAARAFPDRPYVITDEKTYTYAEVSDWSHWLARGLVAAGVWPGDHVGVVMGNYAELVAVKYAIARARAVAVPINFLNRRDELGYVLRQSNTTFLITMDTFRGLDYLGCLDELEPGWESGGGRRLPDLCRVFVFAAGSQRRDGVDYLEELGRLGDDAVLPAQAPDPGAMADVLYTSGTTGQPKGVVLTHDMLTRTAYGSAFSRAFDDGHRVAFSLPMYHVFGYVEGMLAVVYAGGAVVPQLEFTATQTLRGIEEHAANDALLIPTMTMALLDEMTVRPRALPALSCLFASGAYSPPWIWGRIREVFGDVEVTTGYGQTETTATTTLTDPDGPDDRIAATNGRMRPAGCAGDPALGGSLVEYRLVDPISGETVAPGKSGELVARGPGVTAGYYRKPEETAAAFTDNGWFRSGDLASIDDAGFMTLLGRIKDVYRCGGEQVVPKEVEDVLVTHPAVLGAHVVPLRDDRMGEVGVAWVVLRDGAAATEAELRDHSAARLAKFKVPRHVLFAEKSQIPVTASGRPRKFLLAQRAAEILGPDNVIDFPILRPHLPPNRRMR